MVILPHYLAAAKMTSVGCLHKNGPSLPKQFLLFTKDIGKEQLPQQVSICLEAWAARTPGVNSKRLSLSRLQALRTGKQQKLLSGQGQFCLSKNNTNQA